MRVRVPRQASTKWWLLLAAAIATAITWWQAGDRPRRAMPAEPGYIWLDAEDIVMPPDGALDPPPDAAR